MVNIRKKIVEKFGHRLRIRVCGLCIEDDKALLVNHHSLNKTGDFWSPPGGGMEFGQSARSNLEREFLEETGLKVEVGDFLFVYEYLSPPLHAVELFFMVRRKSGTLKLGYDPEMEQDEQIIKNIRFMALHEIVKMGKDNVHRIFRKIDNLSEFNAMMGYYL